MKTCLNTGIDSREKFCDFLMAPTPIVSFFSHLLNAPARPLAVSKVYSVSVKKVPYTIHFLVAR